MNIKKIRFILLLALVLVGMFAMVGCTTSNQEDPQPTLPVEESVEPVEDPVSQTNEETGSEVEFALESLLLISH